MTGHSYGMVFDNWVLIIGLHYINYFASMRRHTYLIQMVKLFLKIDDGLHHVLIYYLDEHRPIRSLIQKPFSNSGLDITGYFSWASHIQIIHKILTLKSGIITHPENSNFIQHNYFSLRFSNLKWLLIKYLLQKQLIRVLLYSSYIIFHLL